MRHTLISTTLATIMVVGLPCGVQAQSLGLSFGAEGRLVGGFTDQVPGASVFLFGDLTRRLSLKSVPLAFELGVYGLANEQDTPHETYGTLTWDFKNGDRIAAGVPRPAYDSFAVSAVDTLFPSLGVANVAVSRSLATYGAMYAGYLPYGVRYQHEGGSLRYAASVDRVPNRDTTIASVGVALPVGELTLESAVEVAWGTSTDVSAKLQLTGSVGAIKGGVGYYSPGTVVGPDVLEMFASVAPADRITLAGVVQFPLSGPDDATVGVSARYAISPAVGVSAGVLTDAGSDVVYNAQLDWAF